MTPHRLTLASIELQPSNDGWSHSCGCHPRRGTAGSWWLCQYHEGFEDGIEAISRPRPPVVTPEVKMEESTVRADRTVHATSGSNPPHELVRYDKSGKWYIEWPDGDRERITVDQAVNIASRWWETGGSPHFDRPGGARFDYLMRKRLST